jgi:hypothetical protein
VRQFILVIVLVAAAFGGGAFVNGPGLQWAQTRLLRSLGLNNGGEIASIDLKSVRSPESSIDEQGLVKPEREPLSRPRASTPSLLTENESSQDNTPDPPSPAPTTLKDSSSGPKLPRPAPSSTPTSLEQQQASTVPSLEPPVADPDVKLVSAPSSPPKSRLDPDLAPALLDTLAGLLPPNRFSSDSAPAQSSSPPHSTLPTPGRKSISLENEDWIILERKMQSLGISRYTAEGEPGGRVVFSCLIPLAGRQAVAQRFEAEGDDLVQATRAVLRRITLWRATQPSSQ